MLAKNWAAEEFSSAKFKDYRLGRRFTRLISEMANSMSGVREKSESKSSNSFSKGAKRFFMNERVELNEIFDPHVQANISRITPGEYVLNIQDTSGLNYHKHNSKIDIGNIGSSPNRNDAYGYWLHTGLLTSQNGSPLGLSYQELWSREKWFSDGKNASKSRIRRIPIENKESFRWLEGVGVCKPYREAGAKMVHICDREADIYELFQHCDDVGDFFLIRTKGDRLIESNNYQYKLKDFIAKAPTVGEKKISIQGNSDRRTQIINAKIKVRNGVIIPPVSNRSKEEADKLHPLKLTVIQVSSRSKIDGKVVNWLLVTNLDVNSDEMIMQIIDWYALRWRIEIFFKTLKSGANIENCRLIDLEHLSKYILMQSIIAFRVLQLTFFGRMNPKKSIRTILNNLEWKVISKLLYKKAGRPSSKAEEVIRRVALKGGFIPGKDRVPGVLTVWKGWAWLSVIISEAEALGLKGN